MLFRSEQDENFRFTEMSSQLKGTGGRLSAVDHIGKTRWDIPAANITEQDWAEHRAILEAHRPFREFEICRIDGEGKSHSASVSGVPIFDAQRRFSGYRGIGRDITAMRRDQAILRMEHAVARWLTEATDADSLIEKALHDICETGNWACAQYWCIDEQAGAMRGSVCWLREGTPLAPFVDQSRTVLFAPG